jgi:multidrug efflux pump subunit AcrA (membrane-fusion protein)
LSKKIRIIIAASIVIITSIAVWLIFFNSKSIDYITIRPQKGTFKLTVTTTGELQAKSSIEIMGPTGARQLGIGQMKISKLIPEGTRVKKGDFVAELDKSEVMQKVKEIELSIQKYESQYLQARLDSSLNLSAARDELENLLYSLEEKKLEKEQSVYESPSVIRKVEIDYDKTQRSYEQSKKNYETKVKQSMAKLTIAGADLSKEKQQFERLMQTFNEFTIYAPADGMVTYAREWGGRRKVVGSTISFWDPVVATLPDLSKMESITFVNEVDIQKIKKGQSVKLKLDAMPDKLIWGQVSSVANIGEQRSNSDSKVFEVRIDIGGLDSTLLPTMTTSNEFLISSVKNALYIPLEAIHAENGKNYVYVLDDGDIIKKEVRLGLLNESQAIIEKGVGLKDDILMTIPDVGLVTKTLKLKAGK